LNQVIEDKPFNFGHYWNLVRSRIWRILGLAIIVTVLTTIWANSLPSIYSSTAVLLLKPEQAKVLSLDEVFSDKSHAFKYFNTQREIIQSRRILDKLIDELQLDNHSSASQKKANEKSWVNSLKNVIGVEDTQPSKELSATEKRYKIINRLRKQLNIEAVPNSNLIKLSFQSTSAEMTAKMANSLSQIYMRDIMESRLSDTQKATSWMRERAASLKKTLEESENKLQKFVERSGLINTGEGGQRSLTAQELTALTTRTLKARSKLAELSQRYGPKHPKMIAAQSELVAAERAVQTSNSRLRSLGRKGAQLQELQHEVDSNRKLYETFLNRYKEADEAKTLKTEVARIVDPAVVPRGPIKPNRQLISTVAFVLTLLFGVAVVFMLDLLNSTIRSAEEIESRLKIAMLGLLPLLKFKTKKVGGIETLREMSGADHRAFTESIRTMRTGILLSALDNPHKVILVTSSVPGEGKTTIAENLAISMGKMEKVLLIDCDLRQPSISKLFGIKKGAKGLSELVAGTANFKDCFIQSDEFGIDILNAGTRPPNPLELLSSHRFQTLLTTLEKHYDRIILDSPPVHAVSDALILSQYARGVVYIVQADSTSEHVIKACLRRLEEVEAPMIGAVLNQVNVDKKGGYDYGGYYDEYGYSVSAEA